jgi:hypothetical protein
MELAKEPFFSKASNFHSLKLQMKQCDGDDAFR